MLKTQKCVLRAGLRKVVKMKWKQKKIIDVEKTIY